MPKGYVQNVLRMLKWRCYENMFRGLLFFPDIVYIYDNNIIVSQAGRRYEAFQAERLDLHITSVGLFYSYNKRRHTCVQWTFTSNALCLK